MQPKPASGASKPSILTQSPRHGWGVTKGGVKKSKIGGEKARQAPAIWEASLSARDWHPADVLEAERRRATHSLPSNSLSSIVSTARAQDASPPKPRPPVPVLRSGTGKGEPVLHVKQVRMLHVVRAAGGRSGQRNRALGLARRCCSATWHNPATWQQSDGGK